MAQLYIDQGPGGGNGFMPQFDEAAARMSTSLEEFTVAKRQSLEEKIASLKHLLDVISNSFAIVSALLLLAILGTIFYGFRRAKQIAGHIVQSIAEESRQINQSSESLLSASQSLASANEEQAAAVQENAASMAEISTTIRTTAQNSQAAQEKSSKVSEDAEHGRTIVNDLVQAMAVVKKANDELGAIVETVGKISEKTAVINDIVFKTQLLSFNASIEAARAGQHGRGFAVVAEEVGNLAQLSGKAANEIRSIISDSQQQIQGFVHSSRSSIDHVASITNNVQSIFHDIAKDVDTILKQMSDVSHSNTEQQRGMDELTLASRQIDEGTSLNARMAWDVDNQAKLLKQQSEALEKLCDTISRMLVGQSLATGNQSQLPLQPTSGQQDEQSEAPLRLVS